MAFPAIWGLPGQWIAFPHGVHASKHEIETLLPYCRHSGAGWRILPNTRSSKYPWGIEGFIKRQVNVHICLKPNILATEVF